MQFPFEELYYTSSSQGKWQWEAKAGSTSILGITGAQPLSSLIFQQIPAPSLHTQYYIGLEY